SLGRYLSLHAETELHCVGNPGTAIKLDEACGYARQSARRDRVWRIVDDETEQGLAVELQQIGDGSRPRAVKEHTRAPTDHGFSPQPWCVREANSWGKVVSVIVEVVLPVVAHSQIQREVRSQADVVFNESGQHLLEEHHVALSRLHYVSGRKL